MKSLLAILIMFMGMDAYAAVQTKNCSNNKEGLRKILVEYFNERDTSYLDKLAGSWGVKGDDEAKVVIRDSGSLSLGNYNFTACPQGNRVFFIYINGPFGLGSENNGFITISSSGNKATISGGKSQMEEANGSYVKVKKQGNG